jgi:predicted Zn-dependent peptidase
MAYAVKGDIASERDYAYLQIYVGTRPENVQKVKELILEEFKKVHKYLDEKELKQAKEQIIGNYLISQEDSQELMAMMLGAEIAGDGRDADKYMDNINEVKLEDVKELADIKSYSFFALIPEKE